MKFCGVRASGKHKLSGQARPRRGQVHFMPVSFIPPSIIYTIVLSAIQSPGEMCAAVCRRVVPRALPDVLGSTGALRHSVEGCQIDR